MSLRYLLDTNVLSELIKPKPNIKVAEAFYESANRIATATVVLHEMVFGCNRLPPSEKRQAIEKFIVEVVIQSMPILSYDARASLWHAEERARLTAVGLTPAFADGQIAAIAKVNNLTLVTRNISDYANFVDVAIETWHG